jgi:hypothetical protein
MGNELATALSDPAFWAAVGAFVAALVKVWRRRKQIEPAV